ncbi:MAG TPA: hypothetical protein VF972_05505, partial [Actinomycetota bacterium]
MTIRTVLTVVVLAMVATATPAMAGASRASRMGPRPKFSPAVLLTVNKYFGGYEPGVIVDRYNNIFVTAHKQNHGDVVSPDARSATQVRSQSWIWWSRDGVTFNDMPGKTPLEEQSLEFGDEGDFDTDNTGRLYFVDTNVADVTFTRWRATGPGKLTLETTRPVLPSAQEVDDRPWIIAYGAGQVLYFGNEGDSGTYPLGQGGAGSGNGPGRYTVYRSTNYGDTFDTTGYT